MKPYSVWDREPVRAQEALIARMYGEIERRSQQGWRLPADESMPGDALVSSAGRLALIASPSVLNVCEQTLWPRVRDSIGLNAPGRLVWGDFGACIRQTHALMEPFKEFRLAAQTERALSPSHEDLLSVCLNRMEAGWFLVGLEALWPFEGRAAAHRLWHHGLLREWDEAFLANREYFASIQGDLRTSLADAGGPFDHPWLRVLTSLVQLPPRLTVWDAQAAEQERRQDTALIRTLLLEDFLRESCGGSWSIIEEVPTVMTARGETPHVLGFWFPSASEETLQISQTFDMLFCSEVLTVAGDDEEDQEDAASVYVLYLRGYLEGTQLEILLQQDNRIERQAFMEKSHDDCRRVLNRQFEYGGWV